MVKLDKDWLTKDNIDFEYKKYILLSYLRDINHHFDKKEIYPFLGDLIEHFRSLKDLMVNKNKLNRKELRSIDFEKLELIYTTIEEDMFKDLEQLIGFALEELQKIIIRGREIYDKIDNQLVFAPVGILPTYYKEGFIIITTDKNYVFSYKLNEILIHNIPYKIVITKSLDYKSNKILTHESIKKDYIISLCDYVPATFGVYMEETISIDHALLPITKRKIMKFIRDIK